MLLIDDIYIYSSVFFFHSFSRISTLQSIEIDQLIVVNVVVIKVFYTKNKNIIYNYNNETRWWLVLFIKYSQSNNNCPHRHQQYNILSFILFFCLLRYIYKEINWWGKIIIEWSYMIHYRYIFFLFIFSFSFIFPI